MLTGSHSPAELARENMEKAALISSEGGDGSTQLQAGNYSRTLTSVQALTARQASAADGRISQLLITDSINIFACPKRCRCCCHNTTHMQTPACLKSIFGQLLFSYNDLLRATSCDYPPCRKSDAKVNVAYVFCSLLKLCPAGGKDSQSCLISARSTQRCE